MKCSTVALENIRKDRPAQNAISACKSASSSSLSVPWGTAGLEAGQLYHALEQQKLLRRAEGAVLPTQRLPVLQALPQGHPGIAKWSEISMEFPEGGLRSTQPAIKSITKIKQSVRMLTSSKSAAASEGTDTDSCIHFMVSFSLLISSKKLSTWSIFPMIKWTSVNFLWFTSKRKHNNGEPS